MICRDDLRVVQVERVASAYPVHALHLLHHVLHLLHGLHPTPTASSTTSLQESLDQFEKEKTCFKLYRFLYYIKYISSSRTSLENRDVACSQILGNL